MPNKDYELIECSEKDNSLETTVENLQFRIQEINNERKEERFLWICSFIVFVDAVCVFSKAEIKSLLFLLILEFVLVIFFAYSFKIRWACMFLLDIYSVIKEKFLKQKK